MVSTTLCHESYSSCALHHILSSLVDMGVVVVVTFVASTLARSSVLLVLSRDISHVSMLSQIASLFKCTISNCSTIFAGQNSVW